MNMQLDTVKTDACGTSGSSIPFWPVSWGAHATLCVPSGFFLLLFLASASFSLDSFNTIFSSTSYYSVVLRAAALALVSRFSAQDPVDPVT